MYYTKPPEVDRKWPSMARIRIAVRAIYGPAAWDFQMRRSDL